MTNNSQRSTNYYFTVSWFTQDNWLDLKCVISKPKLYLSPLITKKFKLTARWVLHMINCKKKSKPWTQIFVHVYLHIETVFIETERYRTWSVDVAYKNFYIAVCELSLQKYFKLVNNHTYNVKCMLYRKFRTQNLIISSWLPCLMPQ